jgi:hypothetical protein
MGTSATSEPEVQHTSDYFRSHAPIYGGIDWHSYSQLILRPWGWTSDDAPDEAKLKECGDEMKAAAEAVHGSVYISQKGLQLYATSGTARDWFYSEDAARTNRGFRSYVYSL